jgi:hypothetical protein
MKVTWIDGPMWRISNLAESAVSSGITIRWCSSPSDINAIRDIHSIIMDPFSEEKCALFVGRDALEEKSISHSIQGIVDFSDRLTVVVFNSPKSLCPSLRRTADESGSYRKWDTTLSISNLLSEMSSVLGRAVSQELAHRLSWCVSSSSWSDDVDADVARMECVKLATIHQGNLPSEEDIILACFRQRSEAMKFILNAIEQLDIDLVIREATRGERMLGKGFYGLAISSLIQIWRNAKLDAMRSSALWSKDSAMSFMKPEKDGKSAAMFNPRAIEKIDRSDPKSHVKSMAAALFSSICVASRSHGDIQEQMWKTRFYAVLLLSCGSLSPKDVDTLFRATDLS